MDGKLWISKDPLYGPYLLRVGDEPFGFADYQSAHGQWFTLLHLSPAGHYVMPFSATVCLFVTIALVLLAIAVGWGAVRRRMLRAGRHS